MEIVSARIEMRVGVSEAMSAVGGMAVSVAADGVDTCGVSAREEGGVDRTFTEKLQASSNSVLNTKGMVIFNHNHLRRFIALSLCIDCSCFGKSYYKSFAPFAFVLRLSTPEVIIQAYQGIRVLDGIAIFPFNG